MKVKHKLIAFGTCLVLLPSLIVGAQAYSRSSANAEQQAILNANQSVNMLNNFITLQMGHAQEDIDYFTQYKKSDLVGQNQSNILFDTRQFSAAQADMQPYIGTATGAMLPPDGLPSGYDPRVRPWYKLAEANPGHLVYTDPYIDAKSGDVVVTLAKTTVDGYGVVGVDMNIKDFANLAKTVRIGQAGRIVIISKNDNFVVTPYGKPGTEATDSAFKDMLSHGSGTVAYQHNEIVYQTNPQTGWVIGAVINPVEIRNTQMQIEKQNLLTILIALILSAIPLYILIRMFSRPLKSLISAVKTVSSGDLSVTVETGSKDEFGELADHFNKMTQSLRSLAEGIMDRSNQLAASAEQLNANVEENTNATERISVSMEEISVGASAQVKVNQSSLESVGLIHSVIEQASNGVVQVDSLSTDAKAKAQQGNEVISVTVNQMGMIEQKVQAIGDVVKSLSQKTQEIRDTIRLITDIAGQTNLLALNASIEAARAGELGKGFAVVASEVRKLADDSAQTVARANDLLASIELETAHVEETVEAGVAAVISGKASAGEAGLAFQNIYASTLDVAKEIGNVLEVMKQAVDRSGEVKSSITQASVISSESSSHIETVASATQEQTASMEEISASSIMLAKVAEELQNLTSQFKL